MWHCYIDESGDARHLESPNSSAQPVLSIIGIAFPNDALYGITREVIFTKQRFFPGLAVRRPLDWTLKEIKGADLRRNIRSGRRKAIRQTLGFLDHTIRIIETHNGRLFGRILVKDIGVAVDGRAVYTSAVQSNCRYFQNLLEKENSEGLIIADSRTKALNVNVAHSIFTQMFKRTGDEYPGLVELPTFGHSDNHAGLQIADTICSAIITPIAAFTYCTGHVNNIHVDASYSRIKSFLSARLKNLQYRYQTAAGRWQGGLTVCDSLTHRSSAELFR